MFTSIPFLPGPETWGLLLLLAGALTLFREAWGVKSRRTQQGERRTRESTLLHELLAEQQGGMFVPVLIAAGVSRETLAEERKYGEIIIVDVDDPTGPVPTTKETSSRVDAIITNGWYDLTRVIVALKQQEPSWSA